MDPTEGLQRHQTARGFVSKQRNRHWGYPMLPPQDCVQTLWGCWQHVPGPYVCQGTVAGSRSPETPKSPRPRRRANQQPPSISLAIRICVVLSCASLVTSPLPLPLTSSVYRDIALGSSDQPPTVYRYGSAIVGGAIKDIVETLAVATCMLCFRITCPSKLSNRGRGAGAA